ncbi:MAG: hypothetical protein JSS66_09910 [Armatimonadetes bacterium]|nr:hypothetical protein [Armatimonadota bacterium]
MPALTLLACAIFPLSQCPPTDRFLFEDLQRLTDRPWRGTLTYLDYSSNKHTTIKSTLVVERVAGGPTSWMWYFGYTDESSHDSGQTLELKFDGKRFDDESVVSRKMLPQRRVEVVTQSRGKDNDRPATMRHVYRIGDDEFSLQLLVRYDGTNQFFERHIYRWKR